MSKLTDEIMGKLKAKKAGGGALPEVESDDDAESPLDVSDEDASGGYGDDETAAMQDFMDATDAAGKASALKAFLEVCVPKIVGGDEE